MWFNILKAELASQSGYAQLDFNNIVEEDDENCKREWKRLAKKVQDFASKLTGDFSYKWNASDLEYNILFKGYNLGSIHWDYNPNIPEEVYCKALDMLKQNTVGQIVDYMEHFDIFVVNDNESKSVYISKYTDVELISDTHIGIYLDTTSLENYDNKEVGKLKIPAIKKIREDFKGVLK